jgi:ankyrin repeat protein
LWNCCWLANKADVNGQSLVGGRNYAAVGKTPLQLAVERGRKDIVELLLANKADANAGLNGNCIANTVTKNNCVGQRLLHLAAERGRKDIVELLLAYGAKANAKDGNGSTPLQLALKGNYLEVAELLRQHGGHE